MRQKPTKPGKGPPLTIRLDRPVRIEVERIAYEESRSVSSLINFVLRRWLEERRKPEKKTPKA